MYDKLKDMLCEELEQIEKKGELSAGSLDTIHKLTDSIKNISKIEMLEEVSDYSEYSERKSYARRGSSYDGGSSYRGGGSYSRKRDSMGRYSRADHRYSRADARTEISEHLEELMQGAQTEQERRMIRTAIQALEQA